MKAFDRTQTENVGLIAGLGLPPIADLKDAVGERFQAGVLHTGEQTIALGDRLWALPVSGLWS